MAEDSDRKPVTRGDVRVLWTILGAAVVLTATVVGAYVRLDGKVNDVDRRMTVIETKQDNNDRMLRGIENSVSRIEGRLAVKPPLGEEK